MLRLAPATALAVLSFAASASAAPPTITSVSQKDGRVTVQWTLASAEYESETAEISSRPDTSSFEGEFRSKYVEDTVTLRPDQRSVTFDRVNPGTHYIHVSSLKRDCSDEGDDDPCVTPEWSAIRKFVVPFPPPKRYKGRTSQGRKISFTVREGQIRGLRIAYSTRCSSAGRRTGRLRANRPGMKVRDDNTFSRRFRIAGDDGATRRLRFDGSLRGATRARGTFRLNVRGTPGGPCTTKTVRWKARTP